MKKDRSSFLDMDYDLRRVVVVTFFAVGVLTALLVLFHFRLPGVGVLAVSASVLLGLHVVGNERPLPRLSETGEEFVADLGGSALSGAKWQAAVAVLFLVLLVPLVVLDGSREVTGLVVAFSFAAPVLALICHPSVSLSVSAKGGVLTVKGIFKRFRFSIPDLEVTRTLAAETEEPAGLELRQGRLKTWIPLNQGRKEERQFLAELTEWLSNSGVAVRTRQRTVDTTVLRFLGTTAAFTAPPLFVLLLTPGLVAVCCFWWEWLTKGSANPIAVASAWVFGFAAGFVLLFTPLPNWIWKTLRGRGLFRAKRAGGLTVLLREKSPDPHPLADSIRIGAIRIDRDSLILSVGKTRMQIKRDTVAEVAQRRSVADGLQMAVAWSFRLFGSAVALTWTDDRNNERSVLLNSGHGWMPRRDRALDRDLFRILTEWKEGGNGEALHTLSGGPRWLACAFAFLFVFGGLAVPELHRHFVKDYVLTGRWLPSKRIQPDSHLMPVAPAVEAFHPGPALFSERPEDVVNLPGDRLSRTWMGNPVDKKFRVLPFSLLTATPSFPGRVSHILSDSDPFTGLTVPSLSHPSFGWKQRTQERMLFSLDSCRGQWVGSLPYSSLALYKDERVFWVDPSWTYTKHYRVNLGWMDLKSGERHSLGTMIAEIPQAPLFFPEGRHVLCNWTVFDLDTGERKPVAIPDEDLWDDGVDFAWGSVRSSAFAAGSRLRVSVRYDAESQTHVWEIDPISARLEVVARFAKGVHLKSADGDRWLLAKREADGETWRLQLHDRATSQTRTIFRNEDTAFHALLVDTPHLLSFNKDGMRVREIPDTP